MYKDRKPLLWQKEVYALSTDYTIDLRKNDSLIKPYIGTQEIAQITYSQTFATREAAEACDAPNYKDDESRRYMLLLIRKVNGWLPGYRRSKGTHTLLLLYCKTRQYPRNRVMLVLSKGQKKYIVAWMNSHKENVLLVLDFCCKYLSSLS